ncbi:MAG: proton-conducting transporter membrane subunit [Thermoproteus sp.]
MIEYVLIAATALALLGLRLGLAPSAASVALTLLALGRREELGSLPYIGPASLNFGGAAEPFIATTALLGLAVLAYSKEYAEHRGLGRWFYGVLALYVISLELIPAFDNLIYAFLAMELAVVTSFLLIYYFGYGDRARIGVMYFIWSQIGSIAFLIGAVVSGGYLPPYAMPLAPALLAVFGLLVKMGTAGVHYWLPYAHAEAPTPLSALLSPIHVGLMAYWLLQILPHTPISGYYLALYGAATAVYGSLLVFREADLKRALADSTIANMGLLVAAAALGDWQAAVLLFVGHALAKAAMFMVSGIGIATQNERRLGFLRLDPWTFAGSALGLVALAGVFGIALLGKAYLALYSPPGLAPALYAALFATAVYNFYLFDKLYRAGRSEASPPLAMAVPMILAAAAPYALMLAPWI